LVALLPPFWICLLCLPPVESACSTPAGSVVHNKRSLKINVKTHKHAIYA
jgi:hypothetical protein